MKPKSPSLIWIDAGRRFGFDDLVFWHDRGRRQFADIAAQVDTIVLGPHGSAAFPEELRPFVAPAFTRRMQCDFSDLTTAGLGRAWSQADAHVVYVENPVSRLVLDANRAPPADAMAGLREFYRRLARQRAGENLDFAGVDAVRPITFGGLDVLPEPATPALWAALASALTESAGRTVQAYRDCCEQVLQTVLDRRPPELQLRVISLHDTMNTRMREDGAIVLPRPEADLLPPWANLGNRGDAQGDAVNEPLTLEGAELRRIAAAWADALGLQGQARQTGILLNRPYKGAYETLHHGQRLRKLNKARVGALQVEFLRETLLGPAAVAKLHLPGDDWPDVDSALLADLAAALARAGQSLRDT
jgi:N-formylglutamate amidohydrolase